MKDLSTIFYKKVWLNLNLGSIVYTNSYLCIKVYFRKIEVYIHKEYIQCENILSQNSYCDCNPWNTKWNSNWISYKNLIFLRSLCPEARKRVIGTIKCLNVLFF